MKNLINGAARIVDNLVPHDGATSRAYIRLNFSCAVEFYRTQVSPSRITTVSEHPVTEDERLSKGYRVYGFRHRCGGHRDYFILNVNSRIELKKYELDNDRFKVRIALTPEGQGRGVRFLSRYTSMTGPISASLPREKQYGLTEVYSDQSGGYAERVRQYRNFTALDALQNSHFLVDLCGSYKDA